jgi:Carbohydrate binding domain
MKRIAMLVVPLSIVLLSSPAVTREPKSPFDQRWVWAISDLQSDKQTDDLVALVERAGKCGFNGVVLSDSRLNYLDRVPEGYFKNAARLRRSAEAAGIEIIPCVFPIGSSNGMLARDPNLAEGIEVHDAPLIVEGRTASLIHDFNTGLVNGGLEEVQGHSFAGFAHQEAPGKKTFVDRDESHGGRLSCRVEHHRDGKASGPLLAQTIRVRPNACYRFSAWIKTQDLQPADVHLTVIASGGFARALSFQDTPVQATGDWTQIDVAFNTLDESAVTVGVSAPNVRAGTFWLDDLALEELSLVNVLRRPGCPLTVTDFGDRTVYEEGKDFLPIHDDKLGQAPSPGQYDFHHAGPKLELTAGSRIRDGQRLHVSWYHPVVIHEDQVMCCLAEPKIVELLHEQAKRVNDLFKPKTFFMLHDEARVIGWCKACRDSHRTPGELLAANARRCVEILKEISPAAKVVVWSDMFDPYHNALRSGYYLVQGPLTGSWLGLPPDVVVANWNSIRPADSLKWFSELGHAQIMAGHYIGGGTEVLRKWWEAAQSVPGATGYMYTTWRGDYSQLEAHGKMLRGE